MNRYCGDPHPVESQWACDRHPDHAGDHGYGPGGVTWPNRGRDVVDHGVSERAVAERQSRLRAARRQAAATQRIADAEELQALMFVEPRYRARVAKAGASDAWNAEAELVIVTGAIDALTTRVAQGAISRVAAANTRRRLAAERKIAAEQEAAAHAASNAAIAAGNMPF